MPKFKKSLATQWPHYLKLMRLDRPVGWLILLWPTLMALWLASKGQPSWQLLAVFIGGVIVMRSAGCVINDLADRQFDGQVQRTKNRPLVTGCVSPNEAYGLLAILLLIASLLVLTTNIFTISLSLIALLLASCYPFAKRYTSYPQIVLGAAFGWAIPMAYAAQDEKLSWACWILYAAILVWACAYDTLYAMVDKVDDQRIGVKSTAIAFGKYDKLGVAICHIITLLLLSWLGWISQLKLWFFVSLIMALLLAGYQQWLVRYREPQACFKAFLNNNWFGAILFAGVVLGIN